MQVPLAGAHIPSESAGRLHRMRERSTRRSPFRMRGAAALNVHGKDSWLHRVLEG